MTRAIRSRIVFMAFLSVLVVALLGLGGFTITNLANRVEAANDRNAAQSEQISGLLDDLHASQENAQALYDQLLALGESPQGEAPGDVVTVVPENGRDGDDGSRGEAGKDGRNATDAQVAAALANWCTTFGCTGDVGTDGKDGKDGRDGADSTVPGPAGATGPAGPAGADGRGIQSLMCDETTGRWTVIYTDGVAADAGACMTPLIEGDTP